VAKSQLGIKITESKPKIKRSNLLGFEDSVVGNQPFAIVPPGIQSRCQKM